jgi:MoaA/NifB/PqqE/SkfB family radical SAM enzyme
VSDFVRRVPEAEHAFMPRLGALDIEVTERCDNDCIHCCINLPAGDAGARSRELTTAQWKVVLGQAADLGCLQVRFTGGEPLLRPDFEELYLHARRLGMKVLLFTNARQLGAGKRGEQLVELLAHTPPLVPLEVTVYGMRRESYEAVTRAPGSYEQFRRGIDRLLAAGVPLVVKGVMLPPTYEEFSEFEAWAQQLSMADVPASYVVLLDLRNRRDDDVKNAQIEALRLSPARVVGFMARDESAYRREKQQFAARFMGPPGVRLFRCGAGQAVSVDAFGRAQPCMGVRAPELTVDLADVDEGGLTVAGELGEAVSDGKSIAPGALSRALDAFAELKDVRATNPDYLRRCARCFLHGFCEQCPAKSWSEHGTLDTPVEYLCDVAHAQARHLGWLNAGEKAWEVRDWSNRTR